MIRLEWLPVATFATASAIMFHRYRMKTRAKKRFAGIELGGTTWLIAIAEGDVTNIVAKVKVITTTPEETLKNAINWLKTQRFDAIGIASFGPVDLNMESDTYGYITKTPKPGWSNTEIVGVFRRAFPGTPIKFDTDVNAPALYEVTQGGHGNITSACYITVGTGVGVGVAVGSVPVHGLMHPEGGHIRVPLSPHDIENGFHGVCPFHSDCVEGMVGNRSIAARTGVDRHNLHTIPDSDSIWPTLAHYLAHLCANLLFTVSPQVIVIGGGLSKRPILLQLLRQKFETIVNDYVQYPPVDQYIVSSFHKHVGLIGSLELARLALV
uniref:fructokinase n=1 Tax=Albugo laibachii Nc14 TaxID=890382 RepID=F0WDT5_9STRA|nr:unnamed protein product [Albugo laibachii Nc14]|eukprot:CCA19362.1 unnamed protein product [Albugo laibachii Nc14]